MVGFHNKRLPEGVELVTGRERKFWNNCREGIDWEDLL